MSVCFPFCRDRFYPMFIVCIILGIIQLWRRVADCTLIDECIDDIVIDDRTMQGVSGTVGICFEREHLRT
jgi:hypothetical protein